MLHFVYGTKNSSKNEYIEKKITSCLEKGEHVLLIVPERRSVAVEKAMISAVPDTCKLNLEVLSFRRLCNRVFRQYGGLKDQSISKGGKILVLWQVLRQLQPHLTLYKDLDLQNRLVISSLLDALTTLDRAAITNTTLETLSEKAAEKGNAILSSKLADIALIRAAYRTVLEKDFHDPENDLVRLCEVLETHNFFGDYTVFIDQTASFSGNELAVIGHILRQSPSVTITLGRSLDDDRDICRKLFWCERTLRKVAESVDCTVVVERSFPENPCQMAGLSHLRTNLFFENPAVGQVSDGIDIYSCQSRKEEAEMIACAILDHVQTGGRFRENVIALRNVESYRGILDRRLRAANIPFYFAEKRPLLAQSAVQALLLALRCVAGNYRQKDVLAYLKTGFTTLTFEQGCKLEEYVKIWQIEGRRFRSDFLWCMNPKGRSIEITPDQSEKLALLNDCKNRLILPLEELSADQKGELSVRERATLLYRFYQKNRFPDRILESAHQKNAEGDNAGAVRLCQTNDLICACLDELVKTCGELPVSLSLFAEMFTCLLEQHDIGSIPQKNDEVLVTDVFSLGSEQYQNLYLADLCDGNFPAATGGGGLFENEELKFFENEGIDLPGMEEHRALDEYFAFWEAVSTAQSHLVLSYPARDNLANGTAPSPFLTAVTSLFDDLTVQEYASLPLWKRMGSVNMLKNAYYSGKAGGYAPIFEKAFGDTLTLVAYGGGIDEPFALSLYGNDMMLSQSKLESFIDCPFAYTCRYLFKLSPPLQEETAANEYGTLMHAVFEQVLRELAAENQVASAEDSLVLERIEAKLATFRDAMVGQNEDPRTLQLIRRAGATAFLLLTGMRDEFSHSRFRPAFFELPFGMKSEDGALTLPKLTYLKEENLSASLRGIADRVDVYRDGENLYFRIVDYKTGNKEFRMDELQKGLSGQMLLYMRAVCDCKDPKFLAAIGADANTKLHPAGAVYCIARRPQFTAKPKMDEKDILRSCRALIRRNGIVINDEELLRSLDDTEKGTYLPQGRASRVDDATFRDILDTLPKTLSDITKKLHSGCSDIAPRREGSKHDACGYCEFGAVCRYKDKKEGEGNE